MNGSEIGVAYREHRQVSGHRQTEISGSAHDAHEDARAKGNDCCCPPLTAQDGDRIALSEFHKRRQNAELRPARVDAGFGVGFLEAGDSPAAWQHAGVGGQQSNAPTVSPWPLNLRPSIWDTIHRLPRVSR